MYNEDLIKIIKDKEFKTFWHCLDYLILAGYPNIDAIGISLKEFGNDIFKDVAFGRNVISHNPYLDAISGHYSVTNNDNKIVIGLICDENKHLSGIYKLYREWLRKGNFSHQNDIESTCEVIVIGGMNEFILNYLIEESVKVFGEPLFVITKNNDKTPTRSHMTIEDYERQIQREAVVRSKSRR